MRRRLVASALTALMLVACNAILGLDGDTVLAPADATIDVANDAFSATDGTTDGNVVVETDAPSDAPSDVEIIDGGPPGITLATGVLGGDGYADDQGPNARFGGLSALVLDKDGNHYVVDGAKALIRRIDGKTLQVSTFAGKLGDARVLDGTGAAARFENISAMAYDGDHLLYVTERFACLLRTIDTGTGQVSTIIGAGLGCGDTTASTARLKGPTGVAIQNDAAHKAHLAYIADPPFLRAYNLTTTDFTTVCGADTIPGIGDCTDHRVDAFDLTLDLQDDTLYYREGSNLVRLDRDRTKTEQLTGMIGGGTNDGKLSTASFSGTGLALGETGNEQLFIGNDRALALGVVPTDGLGPVSGSNTDPAVWLDAPTAQARFEQINALWHLGPFNYEIADRTTLRVLTGNVVQTIAGRGRATGYHDGSRDETRLAQGLSPTLGPNGLVYFYDAPHCTVRSYDPATGVVKTVAGEADMNGQTNGDAGAALLDDESDGIVFDGTSIIYSSSPNSTIRSIDPTTGAVKPLTTTFGLTPALAFGGPNLVYSTGSGRQSLIAWNSKLPDAVTTIAGVDGVSADPSDGTGTAARFGSISGVCFDASLNAIYVADQAAFAVRRVQLGAGEAVVKTIAGKLGQQGYVDASGEAARFGLLDQIACDGKGHAYVNERFNGLIRRIDLATGAVKTIAGAFGRQGIALGNLPGGLNQPLGPVVLPNGHLLVGSAAESAIVEITVGP